MPVIWTVMVAVEFLLFVRIIVPVFDDKVPRGIKLTRSEVKLVLEMVRPDPKLVRFLACVCGAVVQVVN